MLIPKKARNEVYKQLFEDGVMVAKKDFNSPKHAYVKNVPNLYVIKLLTSLKSRGYVTERFSWQWYYWYLTNEGIEYLREYLHLPETVVPETLQRKGGSRAAPRSYDRRGGDRGDRGGRFGDRGDGEKKLGAPGNYQPGFRAPGERSGGDRPRGGFGRGRGSA